MRLAGSIARVADSFQVFVRKWLRRRSALPDSSTVSAAASRWWSAVVAIVASGTALQSVLGPLATSRSGARLDAISGANSALAITPADSAATGGADVG